VRKQNDTYHFTQVMCFGWNWGWSIFVAAMSLLLMLLFDYIVWVFFYVVTGESEAERHVWLIVDGQATLYCLEVV
jgi:hypothetical protein